jgi:hypothetical protein
VSFTHFFKNLLLRISTDPCHLCGALLTREKEVILDCPMTNLNQKLLTDIIHNLPDCAIYDILNHCIIVTFEDALPEKIVLKLPKVEC